MPVLRIATFNVENLFSSPPSQAMRRPEDRRFGAFLFDDPKEAFAVRRAVEAALSDDERQLTAQALIDCEADIVCLQEVESQSALENFRKEYLHRTLRPRVAAELRIAHPLVNAGLAAAADRAAAIDAGKTLMKKAREAAEARHFYNHLLVVDGNDTRGIDVGVLSKLPIVRHASHAQLRFCDVPGAWTPALNAFLRDEWRKNGKAEGRPEPTPEDRVFRRDCLRIDVEKEGRPLSLFICHFKANAPFRAATHPLRVAEAKAVKHLIQAAFGDDAPQANWLIAGDLNDYADIDGDPLMPDLVSGEWQPTALTELVGGPQPFGFDACARIADPTDRWTSYYQDDDIYTQLDHIILSPALAARNAHAAPDIIRKGLPYRAARYAGPRYPRVGWDRPKASDHCPLAITLAL